MILGYIQYLPSERNKEDNFKFVEKHLKRFTGGLVVLPELSFVKYLFKDKEELGKVAEDVPGGPSCMKMLDLSEKYDCTIIFGVPEKDGFLVYDTAVIADKGRYAGKYRKMHLTDYEKTLFAGGKTCGVFSLGKIKIGLQICFDLWYPALSRMQVKEGADLFCVLAGFGKSTTYDIAKARAAENLTPLIMCNRFGKEKKNGRNAYFKGSSVVLDGLGEVKQRAIFFRKVAGSHDLSLVKRKGNIICENFRQDADL